MAKFKLGLDSLAQVDDGLAKAMFDKEIAKSIADCRDRPRLLRPREVTVKLKMHPHPQDEEDVVIAIEVAQAKLPGAVTDTVRMQTNAKGEATFRSEFNDNPHQQSLYDGDGKDQENGE